MKTYGYRTVTKSLPVGLRRFATNVTNRPGLSDLYNLVPTEAGLASPELPDFPPSSQFDASTVSILWPTPQLVQMSEHTLAITDDTVYRKSGLSEGGWNFEQVDVLDAYNFGAGTLNGRNIWHVADNGAAFILTNGSSVLFKTPLLGKMWGYDTEQLLVNNNTTFNTCCTHRGRTILGGFDSATWSTNWYSMLQTWAEDLHEDLSVQDMSLKQNMVLWGPVGGTVLWLFYATLAQQGLYGAGEGYDSTRTFIMDLFRKNDLGWLELPFSGEVLRVAPLGRYLMAYTGNGSVPLNPIAEPVATYGLVDAVGPGTLGRNSVGVSPHGHLYIDSGGYLRFRTPDLADIRLGYQEIFGENEWLRKNTVINWNGAASEFYIANGQHGYCLKMSEDGREILGLGEINRLYTSVYQGFGHTYGVYDLVGHGEATFRSNELTFDSEGLKTVQSVDVGVKGAQQNNAATVLVRLHYKFEDNQQEFDVTDWVPANETGQAVLMQAGKRFMVEVAVANDGQVEIDRCELWVQHDDNRFRRGVYVD